MTVVGKISGEGTVKILGRIEGELHATTVLIAEGAEVEGDIVAEDLTVGGRVKGIIHANRVKLNGTAIVEGDIFHRSLSIEENARFEGSSRRDDAVIDTPRLPLSRSPSQLQTHAAAAESSQKLNGAPDAAAHASDEINNLRQLRLIGERVRRRVVLRALQRRQFAGGFQHRDRRRNRCASGCA